MALPNILFPRPLLEVVGLRPALSPVVSTVRPRVESKPSLPSRIAVIGNYLPRHCGIATFTTDLCEAISGEYGTRPIDGNAGERYGTRI